MSTRLAVGGVGQPAAQQTFHLLAIETIKPSQDIMRVKAAARAQVVVAAPCPAQQYENFGRTVRNLAGHAGAEVRRMTIQIQSPSPTRNFRKATGARKHLNRSSEAIGAVLGAAWAQHRLHMVGLARFQIG